MNRSPAFQFYPDKWQSHTRRLSDSAYRVYHELICWMWQSSPDHCSIDADPEAVAVAIAMPVEKVKDAFAEINNAFAPLLQTSNGRWVSNGLRKESEKQKDRREKAKLSANARHNHANASKNNANASFEQCSLSPSPSSSSPPVISESERVEKFPECPPMGRKEFDVLAEMRGVPADCRDWFWNTYDSRNWMDSQGQPVRKIEPLLLNALKKWRSKPNSKQPEPKQLRETIEVKSL